MKYARQRWFGAAAIWLGGLIAPASADPIIFPEDPEASVIIDAEGTTSMSRQGEAAISISDATGSVRTGQSASASLSVEPAQQVQFAPPPAPSPNPLAAEQVVRPAQPIFPEASSPYQDAGVGFAQTRPDDSVLWRVGRTTFDQYGATGGYTQFNAFLPLFSESGDSVTFINPRAGITDYGFGLFSIGGGQRYYSPSQDRVWGASAWYDYDDSNRRSFSQFGGSFESIGRYFSLRSNFTIPVATKSTQYGLTYGTASFQGSNIAVPYTYFMQSAYQQYDVEAAVPMPVMGRYGFDLGLGMYLLTGSDARSSFGGSVRSQAQISENVWLNGKYTYDHIFESQFTINFEFTMPNGKRSRLFRRSPVKRYLTQSVQRIYRVPVGTTTGAGSTLATDVNGNIINVAYIDPNFAASMGGAGTVDNPFLSVADYMSKTPLERDIYSMIFVNPRNDASSTHLDTGIGLLDNQILVGNGPTASGDVPTITAYVNGVAQTINLQITGTTQPFLSNAGAPGTDVVTLANNNEVVGFKISATNTANGISGSMIDGFNIHDNALSNVINGIQITSDTSSGGGTHYGRIANNTIAGQGFGAINGIFLEQTAGTLNLLVDANTISGFRGEDANNNGILDAGEDVNSNLILDSGHGLMILANGGDIIANTPTSTTTPTGIFGNTIVGNANGAQITATNSSQFDLALDGNNISNNLNAALGGINLLADNGTFNVTSVSGNTVADNVGNGLSFLAQNGGSMAMTGVIGNSITGNSATGLTFRSNGAGTEMTLNGMTGNVMTENGPLTSPTALSGGAAFIADNQGSLVVNGITGNSFSQNTGNGVSFLADNTGSLQVRSFYSNLVSENTQDGVSIVGRNNGSLSIAKAEDLNQNGVLNTGEDLNSNGLLDLGFFGNIITSNENNGVYVMADNADVNANIGSASLVPDTSIDSPNNPLRNQINDNGRLVTVANDTTAVGSGVYMTTLNGGTVIGGIDGNTVAANASAGIQIAPDNGVVNLASISNNFILNNGLVDGQELPSGVSGGDSIVYAPSNGGTFSVGNFVENTISGNRGAIIRVGGDGGTINLGTIRDTTFDLRTHGTSGVLFDATNATITGTLINNVFIGSPDNANLSFGLGGHIRGGDFNVTIQDNVFDTTAGAGIGLIFDTSDDRPGPGPGTPPGTGTGTGTPMEGQAANANVQILGNVFQNILAGTNPDFDGAGISLQLQGRSNSNVGDPNQPPGNGSDVNNNVDPGVHFTGTISGNLIGSLNGSYQSGDTLVTNAGPGIQIKTKGDAAIDQLSIDHNIISNNRSDGIQVRRSGSGIVNDFTITDNVIQNNLEDGIDIVGTNSGLPFGVEEILEFEINNNQILNNGFLTDGTQGSAGRGIQLRAEASAVMEVNIDHNIISGNRLSGIESRTATDTYLYDGPMNISDRIGGSDGIIYGLWQNNIISQNGFIQSEDINRNGILDAGEDTNGNGALDVVRAGDGISLGRINMVDPDSPADIIEGFNNGGMTLPDGTLPLLTIQNNSISGNALDGIQIFLDKSTVTSVSTEESSGTNGEFVRTSNIDILNNDLVLNGSNGFHLINASQAGSTATFNFNNNLVQSNGLYSGLDNYVGRSDVADIGDGLEIVNAFYGTTNFNAANNSVLDNNGRGFNILNAGAIATYGRTSVLNLNLDRNTIEGNAREGFYLVNAPLTERENGNGISKNTPVGSIVSGFSSASWLADTDSNHALFDYGRSFSDYAPNTPPANVAGFLDAYSSSDIFSTRPVTNLIFTNNIVDNNGGFVTSAANGVAYNTLGGLVIRIGSAYSNTGTNPTTTAGQHGGVVADIENNRMSGNVGRDVYFNGFVATAPPYVSTLADPLIRFDLTFENNTGGSISVANFDAYYTNTAPVRTPPGNVKRPNPPYTTAEAQAQPRAAWRGLGLDPNGLTLPGFGASTLRIHASGATPDTYGNWIGNNRFNLIYSDFDAFWQVVPDAFVFPTPFAP